MRTRSLTALAVSLALVLAAGACSKSDETSTSNGPVAQSDSGSSEKSSTTASNGEPDSGDISPDDLDAAKDADKLLGTGNCLQAYTLFLGITSKAAAIAGGASEDDIKQLEADIEELKGEVPDEIKDDVDTYATGMTEYMTALQEVMGPDGNMDLSKIDQLSQLSEKLDSEEMTQAADNISKYLEENCKG